MATPKKAASSAAPRPTPEQQLKPFENALAAYHKALAEAQVEVHKRLETACRDHQKVLQELSQHGLKAQREAHDGLMAEAQEASVEGGEARLREAQRKQLTRLQQAELEVQRGYEQGCSDYADTQQQVVRDAQDLSRKAGRDYLKALQKAWAEADVETMDGAVLAAIGHSLVAAAPYVAASGSS